MKALLTVSVGMSLTPLAQAAFKVDWSYEGDTGPNFWARLTPDFTYCNGSNQSPIDLTGFVEANLEPLEFDYKSGGDEIEYNGRPESILNNGHTIEIDYEEGSFLTVDDIPFELVQFHFHAPSENHINGQSYPLEAHLVHSDGAGNLAVVAVMFEVGESNSTIAKAWEQLPQKKGDESSFSTLVDASGILPENRDYYRFNGSLTTPPCSEGVRWLVMKEPMTASAEQIAALETVLQLPNNRPIQPINSRVVLE